MAVEFAKENMIYALVAIAFLNPAEKFFKKMFALNTEKGSDLSAAATGALFMNAINKMKTVGSGGKGESGGSKEPRTSKGYMPGPEENIESGGGPNSPEGGPNNNVPPIPPVQPNPGNNSQGGNSGGGGNPGDPGSSEGNSGGGNSGGSSGGSSIPGARAIFGQTVNPARTGNIPHNSRVQSMWRATGGKDLSRANLRKKGKKVGRGIRKTITGAVGGFALGTIGLAAGLSTGDPSKVFEYAVGAGAVGATLTAKAGDKVTEKGKEIKEDYRENKWGTEEYKKREVIKEIKSNPEYEKVLKSMPRKEKDQLLRQFTDNGITNANDVQIDSSEL